MGSRIRQSQSSQRDVWADEIKRRMDEIQQKRKELDADERLLRQQCNHTFPDGKSAVTTRYADPYGPEPGSGTSTYCTVCKQ